MRGPSAIQERIDLIPEREACLLLVGWQEFEGSPLAQSGQRGVHPPSHQLRHQRSVRCSAVPNPPVPRGQIARSHARARSRQWRRSSALIPRPSAPAPQHRREVVGKNGDVTATFLVDGFVSGIWRTEAGRVRVEPFAPMPRVSRREVDDEAARLEAWLR